jgi:hypothetical protein
MTSLFLPKTEHFSYFTVFGVCHFASAAAVTKYAVAAKNSVSDIRT